MKGLTTFINEALYEKSKGETINTQNGKRKIKKVNHLTTTYGDYIAWITDLGSEYLTGNAGMKKHFGYKEDDAAEKKATEFLKKHLSDKIEVTEYVYDEPDMGDMCQQEFTCGGKDFVMEFISAEDDDYMHIYSLGTWLKKVKADKSWRQEINDYLEEVTSGVRRED